MGARWFHLRTGARFRASQLLHLVTADPLWRTPYHNVLCAGHKEPMQSRRHPKGGRGFFCRSCGAFADRGIADA